MTGHPPPVTPVPGDPATGTEETSTEAGGGSTSHLQPPPPATPSGAPQKAERTRGGWSFKGAPEPNYKPRAGGEEPCGHPPLQRHAPTHTSHRRTGAPRKGGTHRAAPASPPPKNLKARRGLRESYFPPHQQIPSGPPVIPGGLGPARGGCVLPGRSPVCTGDGDGEAGGGRSAGRPGRPCPRPRGGGGAEAPHGDGPPPTPPLCPRVVLPTPSPVQQGPPRSPNQPGPVPRPAAAYPSTGTGGPERRARPYLRSGGGTTARGPGGSPSGGHRRYRCR